MKEVVELACLILQMETVKPYKRRNLSKSHNEFVAELSLKSFFPGI